MGAVAFFEVFNQTESSISPDIVHDLVTSQSLIPETGFSMPAFQIFQSNSNVYCYVTSYFADICRNTADSADPPTSKHVAKMAPRNFKDCDHTDSNHPACPACKRKAKKAERAKKAAEAAVARKLARERKTESRRKFLEDVDMEFEFMKSFPIMDTSAREKAEKERADINKMMRDTERQYKGPLLFSDEVREEERKRQISLRKKFNRADARWSQIKEEAELKFYAWANVELESMIQVKTEDLDLELANLDVARFELEDKIAERESILESLRIIRKAGYEN